MGPTCKQHTMWVETGGSFARTTKDKLCFSTNCVIYTASGRRHFSDNDLISAYVEFLSIHLHCSESWLPVVSLFVVAELVCSSLLSRDRGTKTLLGHPHPGCNANRITIHEWICGSRVLTAVQTWTCLGRAVILWAQRAICSKRRLRPPLKIHSNSNEATLRLAPRTRRPSPGLGLP